MYITKKQLGGVLAGFLLGMWLLSATGLFLFIKYGKGFEGIQFRDVALPWNWEEVRPKWGDYFVEKGLGHREAGQWDKAFYFIRVGVAKSPANLAGRLALADLLFQANDVEQAVKVLETGSEFARRNEEFWAKMIQFLEYYQADQEIIRILQKGLEEDLLPPSLLEIATSALVRAYFHQADYETALEVIKSESDLSSQILRCQIYWEQGLQSLAIQELEAMNSTNPNHREIVPQLTRFYEESGDEEKALRISRQTYLKNPYSIGASVNYFRILGGGEAEAEVERFLARVPEIYDNPDALFNLANYLAEAGFPERLSAIIDKATPAFRDSPMVWFLQIEARINGKQFKSAAAMLENRPESVNHFIPLHRILFQSLS